MKFLKLSQVTGEGDYGLVNETGEDDQPLQAQDVTPTMPVTIVIGADISDAIRSWTPRKDGKPGTRVVLRGGAAIPVIETPEQVESAILALYN